MRRTSAKKATELKGQGNQCFKDGDLEGAIEHYTEALEFCQPSASVEAKQLLMSLLSNRAWAYCRTQAWSLAVSDCDAILAVDPSHLKALFRRGQARRALELLEGAKADLERVMEAEPNNRQASAELELVERALKAQAEARERAQAQAQKKKKEE